ncbi:MAG: primosomal protein N', partial [Syntrophorhabdaceae bacterium]|nr:primosomal protein N' [Syntrophorhabdaceae bacterium]
VITGFIEEIEEGTTQGLKEVLDIIDIYPLLDEGIVRLCRWSSDYYITPFGLVLKYAIPNYLQLEQYLTVDVQKDRGYLEDIGQLEGKTLGETFNLIEKYKIVKYLDDGIISLKDVFTKNTFSYLFEEKDNFKKNNEKTMFIGGIKERIEYYKEIIESYISEGNNVLMLMPDYEMWGSIFYDLLKERFKDRVYWYCSSIKTKARMETFFKARSGRGNIILGNKSCLFLPISHLSLIIVERCEEDSYINESGFRFNACEVAVKRAEVEGINIVMGSLSPRVETLKQTRDDGWNIIRRGHYFTHNIKEIRIEKRVFGSGILPHGLIEIIKKAEEESSDVVIYTPRRHYTSNIQCMNCTTIFKCPDCMSVLGYKKQENKTICPLCHREDDYNEICPVCGGGVIRFLNIGAEYIEEAIANLQANIEILRITGDNIKKSKKILRGHRIKGSRIIIGTQLLTKLYGLKCNSLIIIGIEELLNMGGYRAGERIFQTIINLTDVLCPDKVYFFTDMKRGLNISGFLDFDGFYNSELDKRKNAEFPPFKRLFLLEVEKKIKDAGEKAISKIKKRIEDAGYSNLMIGPFYEKKGFHRWRIILKGEEEGLSKLLFSIYGSEGVWIETDPINI